MQAGKIKSFFAGLFLSMFWRLSSWMMSLPAWLTLILHFSAGLDLFWFWLTLLIWLISGVLQYITVLFARSCAARKEEEKPNRNPYSQGKDYFKNP